MQIYQGVNTQFKLKKYVPRFIQLQIKFLKYTLYSFKNATFSQIRAVVELNQRGPTRPSKHIVLEVRNFVIF